MIKTMNYKLALLGFTSLCLMSAANANMEEDDIVIFSYEPESFNNITAGGATRTISYVIQNLGDDPAPVYDLSIIPLPNDSFQDVTGLFTILNSITTPIDGAAACGAAPFTLPPAGSMDPNFCQIDIEIDPSAIDVPDDEIPTGVVDRQFVVGLNTAQRALASDIDFLVTVTGSADSFSLLGNNICNDYSMTNDPTCTFDTAQTEAGMLQVDQDVAALGCTALENATPGSECMTDQITLNGNTVYFNDQAPAIDAASDLSVAMDNITDLECTTTLPTNYFQVPRTVYPDEVYCFEYDPIGSPVVISDVITYRGSGKYIFKIETDPDTSPYALNINEGAKFELMNDACAGNIYWHVDGATEIEVNTLFVGSLMTTDYIEAEDMVGAQALIYGRLLSQADLALQGNAIIDPATLGGDCDCTCGE